MSKVDRRRLRAAARAAAATTAPPDDDLRRCLDDAAQRVPGTPSAPVALLLAQAEQLGWTPSSATLLTLAETVEAAITQAMADDEGWQVAREDVGVTLRDDNSHRIEGMVADGDDEVPGLLLWCTDGGLGRVVTIPYRLGLSVSAITEHVLHHRAAAPTPTSTWRQLQQRLPPALLHAPRLQGLTINSDPFHYGEVTIVLADRIVSLGCCAGPLAVLLADGTVDELAVQGAWQRFVAMHEARAQAAPAVLPSSSWWWGSAWLRVLARSSRHLSLQPAEGCAMDVGVDDRDDGPRLVFTLGGGDVFELDPADGSLSLPGGAVLAQNGATIDGDNEATATVLRALSQALRGTEVDMEMTIDDHDWWLSDYLDDRADDFSSPTGNPHLLALHEDSAGRAQQWWRVVDALTVTSS